MKHFWLPAAPDPPVRRIVSLAPSLTELFCSLPAEGLDVVGRTRYCTHPPGIVRAIVDVGGTKNPDIERILALKPEAIIASKEENRAEDVERLAQEVPVLVTDVATLDDFGVLLALIGRQFDGVADACKRLRDLLDAAATACMRVAPPVEPVAYLIWRKPWMVAGGDTFIQAMLDVLGYRNVFADRNRYPAVDATELRDSGAKTLLLSSEPFPFNADHAAELEAATGLPTRPIDGRLASWYSASTPAALLALLRERLGFFVIPDGGGSDRKNP